MKIACMAFFPLKKMGGAQVFAFNFLSKLHEWGHEPTLYLTDTAYRDIRDRIKNCPFNVRPLGYRTYRMSIYAPMLVRQLVRYAQKKEKYDLWQIIGAYPAGYIACALKGKAPLVLRAHGEDIQKNHKLKYGMRINPTLEKKIADTVNSMDAVICLTKTLYDSYRELRVPRENIFEIPNAVSTSRFTQKNDKAAIRKRYNIPSDTLLLITVGRCHIKKGHDLIPRIAEGLRPHLNFKWLLIGEGCHRIRDEIRQKKLSDIVIPIEEISADEIFDKTGEVKLPNESLIQLLKSSDIFVFPTRIEGFGMVLIEAMAAGIPIVTTESPGVKEIMEHNKTALLSAVDDTSSIVSNIIKLAGDRGLRERLTASCREELAKYNMDNIARQYLELYRQVVKQ